MFDSTGLFDDYFHRNAFNKGAAANAQPVSEEAKAILTAFPWPTREAVELYRHKVANHENPAEYRETLRKVAEHNAMLSLYDGTYDGAQGADAASNYRLLAQQCGARPLHELRGEATSYVRQLERKHQREQILFSILIETMERCVKIDKKLPAFAPR